MAISTEELDRRQSAYKAAVEAWVAAIEHEKSLALVNHDVADLDAWETAEEQQEVLGQAAAEAKDHYEAALREEFYDF